MYFLRENQGGNGSSHLLTQIKQLWNCLHFGMLAPEMLSNEISDKIIFIYKNDLPLLSNL